MSIFRTKVAWYMRWLVNTIVFLFFSLNAVGAAIQFNGYNLEPITLAAPKNTGLHDIYIVENTKNLTLVYQSEGPSDFEWLIYSNLGGGYAVECPGIVKEGNYYCLSNPEGNKGYIIRDKGTTYAFWLVDYSDYELKLESLTLSDDSNCETTVLNFEGNASEIDYYGINGQKEILSRDLQLEYTNLEWNEDKKLFIDIDFSKPLSDISNTIRVIPPILGQTKFSLSGDRFLESWGKKQIIDSSVYSPVAVAVKAFMSDETSQEKETNIIGGNGTSGQSAPYNVFFSSFSTDAVVHNEWQFSKDQDFELIENRFYQSDLDYTFIEEGNWYIRFIGSNTDGSCEDISETFTVSIGASELLVPNAFSPNGDGINDIWKVSYRSLTEFRCWIFNRNGHQVYYFDDPNEGWDGKNGTKFVKPGVYFYIIEALGSDGKKYKRKGDINVLNSFSKSNESIEE